MWNLQRGHQRGQWSLNRRALRLSFWAPSFPATYSCCFSCCRLVPERHRPCLKFHANSGQCRRLIPDSVRMYICIYHNVCTCVRVVVLSPGIGKRELSKSLHEPIFLAFLISSQSILSTLARKHKTSPLRRVSYKRAGVQHEFRVARSFLWDGRSWRLLKVLPQM